MGSKEWFEDKIVLCPTFERKYYFYEISYYNVKRSNFNSRTIEAEVRPTFRGESLDHR